MSNLALLYNYETNNTTKTLTQVRIKQLENFYGKDKVRSAFLGYYKFVPELFELGRHVTNLYNTYGKVFVLKVYYNKSTK